MVKLNMFYVLYNYIIKNSYEQSHFDIPNFKPNTKGDELIFFKENINLAGLIPEIIVFDSRNTFCSLMHECVGRHFLEPYPGKAHT